MDEAMLKSGQYPNVAIEAGTDPAEVMRVHGRADGEHMDNGVSVQMCPNDTGAHSNVSKNSSDSRERLEAEIAHLSYMFNHGDDRIIKSWLDRQAAITRAEVFENGEYDCMTCDAKAELREQVDELTSERDELKERLERANKSLSTMGIIRLNARIDELEAERDRLQADLNACETREKAAADYDFREAAERWEQAYEGKCGEVVRLTAEAERLQHANNTLRASVAGLKMTVEKRKPDPVEIQAQLARFADEWERADTAIQEQRLIACYAWKLANA